MNKNKKNRRVDITADSTQNQASATAVAENEKPTAKKSSSGKKHKWVKVTAALVVIAIVAFFGIKALGNSAKAQFSSYVPQTASIRDLSVSVEGSGTIEPNNSYNVTALVNGDIISAPFNEGDEVQKGQPLYEIDSTDIQTNISRTKLSLDSAKLSYNDILRDTQDLTVKATASGKITKVYVDPGDTVAIGSPLADIVDDSVMVLKVPFHSLDIAKISSSKTADVYISETGEKLSGTITKISASNSAGNGGTLVREVTIEVKNPGGINSSTVASAVIGGISGAANGTFENNASKTVTAKVSGDVKTINSDEGSVVSEGQVIMQLSSTALESQLENARLQVKSAELSLKSAKDALDNYTITAPISGTIVEKSFKEGDTLDAANTSSTLAVIYDMSSLNFKMDIDELDISSIKVGQRVSITAEAVEGKEFTGYVDKININGSTVNGVTSYPVTIIVENSEGLLPGMNITANIVTEEVKNVLTIPVSAVGRGNTVLVDKKPAEGTAENSGSEQQNANHQDAYEKITVELGRSDGDYIEVLSGLSEGDTVYIDTSDTSSFADMMGAHGGMF